MNKVKKILNKIYNKIKRRSKEISLIIYIKTNIIFISYVLINLINSWLLRVVTMGNYFSFPAIISDLAFILLSGSFAYLLKPKKQIKVLMPLTIIMTATCVINAIYYENYVSFASFSLLSTASFLGEMDGAIVTSLIQIKDAILVFPPIVLLIVHFALKKEEYYAKVELIERGKKRFLNTIILSAAMIFLTLMLMKPSDYSRLKKQWNREYLVERFGIYVYQVNDAIKSTQSKFTSLFGYDNAAKTVRDFYEEKQKNDDANNMTNEYTNIFEGKNVIVIHAESIMTHDMTLSFNDKELTPNLNKLANEGLFFSNYYPQVSVGTSSDTEFTFNTSLLPASTGTVFVNYWKRTYEAMPNILRQKQYYTASMHANNASFWNRSVMHKTLGYDKFYAKDTYDYSDDDKLMGMGLSDKEFFKQSVQKIKKINEENKNYYLTLITLSNHTPWDDEDKYGDYTVDYRTKKVDEDGNETEVTLPYMEETELGRYFKAVHYSDEAIGEFIEELKANDLLDNTVVVIYGDHDAKISKKEYRYFYNYDFETGNEYDKSDERYVDVDYYNYELNRKVPFIIWTKDSAGNKKLNKKIDKVMGMYDAMPTLANMLNFDFKYGLGHDIFNVDDNIVVFPNGNWLTDKMYYNAQKEEYLLLKDSVVNSEEIENNKIYANKLLEVSDAIIVYDLEAEVKGEKSKKILIGLAILVLIIGMGVLFYTFLPKQKGKKEVKIIKRISNYGYELRENETEVYKKEFENLDKILSKEEVNYEDYAASIAKLFIMDFYTLDNKLSKNDIGGVDFIKESMRDNFIEEARSTFYKYLELKSDNRNQSLPEVSKINDALVENTSFKYSDKTITENAYKVTISWDYKEDLGYEKEARMIIVKEDKKLYIVEMD